MASPVPPFSRMNYNSSPDHVKINICQTSNQMLISIHSSCVVAIFPKGSLSVFPLIIFLTDSACHKLQGPRNCIKIMVAVHQKMNVI